MSQKLIPKPLRIDEYYYYSAQSVDSLKTDMEELLNGSRTKSSSVNLKGAFLSNNEFRMVAKRQMLTFRRVNQIDPDEKEAAFLYGDIRKGQNGGACVRFIVRPNDFIPISFFIAPILAAGVFLFNPDDIEHYKLLPIKIVFAVSSLASPLLTGYFAKRSLKNRFIKTFGLTSVT